MCNPYPASSNLLCKDFKVKKRLKHGLRVKFKRSDITFIIMMFTLTMLSNHFGYFFFFFFFFDNMVFTFFLFEKEKNIYLFNFRNFINPLVDIFSFSKNDIFRKFLHTWTKFLTTAGNKKGSTELSFKEIFFLFVSNFFLCKRYAYHTRSFNDLVLYKRYAYHT